MWDRKVSVLVKNIAGSLKVVCSDALTRDLTAYTWWGMYGKILTISPLYFTMYNLIGKK